MVVVVDDEDRENEGDIIMAADAVTTEAMAFIVRYCSGVVCVSLESEELDRLALPPMIANNEVRFGVTCARPSLSWWTRRHSHLFYAHTNQTPKNRTPKRPPLL